MRHDRQHPVVMARLHPLDHRAAPPPQLRDLLDRRLIGAGRRRQQRPAPLEQRGKPRSPARSARSPRADAPARNARPAGTSGPTSRITRLLGRSDIRQHRARRQMPARSPPPGRRTRPPGRTASRSPRPRPPRAGSSSTRSAKPSSITRSSVFWVRALTTISAAMSPRSRAMRATEDPISPTPSRASRRKTGSATGLPHEFGQSLRPPGRIPPPCRP